MLISHEFIFICFFFSILTFIVPVFLVFFVFFADFMFGKVVLSCAFIEEQRLNGSNVRQSSEKERADGEPKKIAREFVKISSDSLAKSTTSTTNTIFFGLVCFCVFAFFPHGSSAWSAFFPSSPHPINHPIGRERLCSTFFQPSMSKWLMPVMRITHKNLHQSH